MHFIFFGLKVLIIYFIFYYVRDVKLPLSKRKEEDFFDKMKNSVMLSTNIKMPLYAVAKLSNEEYTNFEFTETCSAYCEPSSLCWTTHGDLLVGCFGGQLLQVEL